MKYAYKTEIKPNEKQAFKIKQSIGICRWLYNKYISMNKRLYTMYQRGLLDDRQAYFVSANDFDKYINNKIKTKPNFTWINNCGSKARKKTLINAEIAMKGFLSGKTAFPKYKYKYNEEIKLYFPKNNKTDWIVERHRIKIPTLKYVCLKEYGYLPTDAKVINGVVSYIAGKYYVSITIERDFPKMKANIENIGLRFSFKDFETISQDMLNVVKAEKIKKKLANSHRKLARKNMQNQKNHIDYLSKNAQKELLKIKQLEAQLNYLKEDYLNKCVYQILQLKPQTITLRYFSFKSFRDNDFVGDNEVIKDKYYNFTKRLFAKAQRYNIKIKHTMDFKNFADPILEVELI